MSEQIIKRYEELMNAGTQLVPQGGFDFSGYNARLQNKYLEWRKACLEMLELSGPIGFPYKNKILGDQNGGFFFQTSAQLILNCIRELYDKLKASPELMTASAPQTQPAQPAAAPPADAGGARVLKPPPKKTQPVESTGAVASASVSNDSINKVYVIGDKNDPLRIQLREFLIDIGLEEIEIERKKGQMLSLNSLQERADIKYAFFVLNSEDMAYAMFEIGHFVGKLGNGHVAVLHMTDVTFPKEVPGVTVKPIVVKLEEASFSIIKELKTIGYKVSI